jgi:hypothetical protein
MQSITLNKTVYVNLQECNSNLSKQVKFIYEKQAHFVDLIHKPFLPVDENNMPKQK